MNFIRPMLAAIYFMASAFIQFSFAEGPYGLTYAIPSPPVGMQTSGGFGNSVAVDGQWIVVGAPFDDLGAQDAGIVKIFDSTTGMLRYIVKNPAPMESEVFGFSVAISGTRVVVGAHGNGTTISRAGSVYVYDLAGATPTTPVLTLNNPTPANNSFGYSVAISGTRVVVGTRTINPSANVERVYVYDLAGATPTVPVTTLTNPTPEAGDLFGFSVAISGSLVVVGADSDNTGATDAGSAYVYDLAGATPQVPILTLNNPTPAAGDLFGFSVAISGSLVVVGADSDNTGATDAGSAYVYDLAGATPAVPVVTLGKPSPVAGDNFGCAVSISGTRIVVGARLDDTGAPNTGSAYVYDLASATPTKPVVTLNNPTPAATDNFGVAVVISGTRVIVGANNDDTGALDAGSAYVYELVSTTPSVPIATLNNPGPSVMDHFGGSVAISGTRMVVGAAYESTGAYNAGSVYVYDLSGATPTAPTITVHNPSPGDSEYFGSAVAIDGTLMVVSMPDGALNEIFPSSVYVYDLAGATPTVPVATLSLADTHASGTYDLSVAISGKWVVVGARTLSKAFAYDLAGATPTVPVATLSNPYPSGDLFGSSVAISGTRVVVGAPKDNTGVLQAGSAYVYDLASASPTVPIATLHNPTPDYLEYFGSSVVISGSTVVVGTPSDTGAGNAGSAYAYDLAGATPTGPTVTLTDPARLSGAAFGLTMAISGTRVIVGTNSDGTGRNNEGSAYVFDLAGATPAVPIATLHNPRPASSDGFGAGVGISGSTVVIGTPNDDTVAWGKGSAYVFAPDTTSPTLSSVTIRANNPNPPYAKLGETITLAFTADESIQTPVVTIAGQAAAVSNISGNNWQATLPVSPNTPDGSTAFSIISTDLGGNIATAVTATTDGSSVIVDRTAPMLALRGANPLTVEGETAYVEPGATANDAISGNLTNAIQITGAVNTNAVGSYTINYSVTDPAGNTAAASRTVKVVDTTPPSLMVLGSNPATVEAGSVYIDAGAIASDSLAGSLTAAIQVASNVDTYTPGNYTVNYSVSDGFNTATAARTVNVVDTTAPTITHLPDPLTVTADATNHAAVPDLTGQVVATDNVGVTGIAQNPAPGTSIGYGPHTITFTVEDAEHHTATGSMVLTVADGSALTGRYAGLLALSQLGGDEIRAQGNIQPCVSGAVRVLMELKLTRGRFLTGYLRLADKRRVWFPGTILPAATHAETLTLNDGSSLALEFDGSGHVAAMLAGGLGVLRGDGVLADTGAPVGVPGTYTAILEAEGATAPGWLYAVVSKSGAMRLSGRMPDGSTINAGQGSLVDRHGDALLFLLGKKPTHPLLAGTAHFANLATSDFSGALAFNDAPCVANGARFTRAPSGLPPGAYPITLEGAGIDIASTVTLLPNNTASVLAPLTKFLPQATAGKPATGIFYTTFAATPTATRPVVRGSGIFHQKLGIGAGQFPRNGAEGRIQLGLAP